MHLDATGTAAGRGAYVHADRTCVDRAVRSGALARALRTPLDRAEAARLMTEVVRTSPGEGAPGARVKER